MSGFRTAWTLRWWAILFTAYAVFVAAVWWFPNLPAAAWSSARRASARWSMTYYEHHSIATCNETYEDAYSDDFEAETLDYLLYRPDGKAGKQLPLLLVLHGSGQRGHDVTELLRFFGSQFVDDSWQSSHECTVVMPQCPPNMSWRSTVPFDIACTLEKLIDKIESDYAVDRRRIYLIGYSMGGFGCWHLAARYPSRFAAVIPVAGGGQVSLAKHLLDVPVWAIHGEQDDVVPIASTVTLVDTIDRLGGHAKLTRIRGVGHDSWHAVADVRNPYLDWMFDQTNVRR